MHKIGVHSIKRRYLHAKRLTNAFSESWSHHKICSVLLLTSTKDNHTSIFLPWLMFKCKTSNSIIQVTGSNQNIVQLEWLPRPDDMAIQVCRIATHVATTASDFIYRVLLFLPCEHADIIATFACLIRLSSSWSYLVQQSIAQRRPILYEVRCNISPAQLIVKPSNDFPMHTKFSTKRIQHQNAQA